jgi:hypothetical protein
MKRSKFSDEQIIGVLKEQEAGMATADKRASVVELNPSTWPRPATVPNQIWCPLLHSLPQKPLDIIKQPRVPVPSQPLRLGD